jgi:hypothetical protein
MTKSELLLDLQTPASTLEVLQKGYLFQVPLDEEIYQALVQKLSAEANGAGKIIENADDSLPTGAIDSALAQLDEINKVVFSTILNNLHKDPYISASIIAVQKAVGPTKVAQLNHYLSEGFSFTQDPLTDNFKILDKTNSLVATYPYQSIKDILQDLGVDTTHPMFYLFYAAIFPRSDLELFRTLFTFNLHFHFT